jgi:hypothetical protein
MSYSVVSFISSSSGELYQMSIIVKIIIAARRTGLLYTVGVWD